MWIPRGGFGRSRHGGELQQSFEFAAQKQPRKMQQRSAQAINSLSSLAHLWCCRVVKEAVCTVVPFQVYFTIAGSPSLFSPPSSLLTQQQRTLDTRCLWTALGTFISGGRLVSFPRHRHDHIRVALICAQPSQEPPSASQLTDRAFASSCRSSLTRST